MNLGKYDAITRREIEFFVERKDAEQAKLRGQIARDLRKLGEYAFLDDAAYRKLQEKYRRAHAGKKKLAILEMERRAWCK